MGRYLELLDEVNKFDGQNRIHIHLGADVSLKPLSVPKMASEQGGSMSLLLIARAKSKSQGLSRHPATKLSQKAPLEPKPQDPKGDVAISCSPKWPPAEPFCPLPRARRGSGQPLSTRPLHYLRARVQLASSGEQPAGTAGVGASPGHGHRQQLGSTFLPCNSQGHSQK